MTDIHCHILPGVDDGSPDLQNSMLMAAMAVDDGVRAIIATPHFSFGSEYAEECLRDLRAAYERLRASICEADMPLALFLGAEVLCTPDTIKLLKHGLFPTMNGTEFSLVEFYFDAQEKEMNRHLEEILAYGITPIIAHPERFDAVQRNKALPGQWRRMGCLLQVNKGSLYGQFGRRAQKSAKRILDERLASFVATDAHDVVVRTTPLRAAREKLVTTYDEEYANTLLEEMPQKLLGECAQIETE